MREDFTDRMQEARDIALTRRNRGFVALPSTSTRADRYRGIDSTSWFALVEMTRQTWRADCRQIRNDFTVTAINNDNPNDWNF